MVRVMGGVALATLAAVPAFAGGLERSSQSVGILFEKGTYAELTLGRVEPDVSGEHSAAAATFLGTFESGNMTRSYGSTSFGFKTALSENLDMALILDRPVGAAVSYPVGTGYIYAGSTANVDSTALTVLARYKLPNNFSVYGGVRNQRAEGQVALFNGYTMTTDTSEEWGYVVGAAWEKPEIAARVALTYNSAITHEFNAAENISLVPTEFETEIPQSVNLEFQTGIAADTLLFGSVRWQEWSKTDITPAALFAASGSSLVDYDDDVITYNLGVGRRFNEKWSGAITAGYEKSQGGFVGNLGPTDGFTSLGVAATYTMGQMKITGGARYI